MNQTQTTALIKKYIAANNYARSNPNFSAFRRGTEVQQKAMVDWMEVKRELCAFHDKYHTEPNRTNEAEAISHWVLCHRVAQDNPRRMIKNEITSEEAGAIMNEMAHAEAVMSALVGEKLITADECLPRPFLI